MNESCSWAPEHKRPMLLDKVNDHRRERPLHVCNCLFISTGAHCTGRLSSDTTVWRAAHPLVHTDIHPAPTRQTLNVGYCEAAEIIAHSLHVPSDPMLSARPGDRPWIAGLHNKKAGIVNYQILDILQ